MDGAKAALALEGVTKRFGDVLAVDDLTVEVAPAEFFSLLGPSGCGKTTTLRVVGGFDEPDAGRVLLDGEDVTMLPPHKRHVNTVFQSYALFPHMSVFDNVAYGLKRRGADRAEISRLVGEMLEIVDLPSLHRRKPSQLSGGQQQRVALARALVNRPSVLLLDEPLGALDSKLRRQMQLELKRIQHEVGVSFVYVTHDQDEAMTMSDRLAVMRHGRIEQIGAPRTVYEHPATEFVAMFLGAANLLAGKIERRDGDWLRVALDAGGVVRVPSSATNGSEPVRIGVRPEKISIALRPRGEGDNVIEAELESAAFTGVAYECTFTTTAGDRIVVYRQNQGEAIPEPGDKVVLSWRPEHTFAVR